MPESDLLIDLKFWSIVQKESERRWIIVCPLSMKAEMAALVAEHGARNVEVVGHPSCPPGKVYWMEHPDDMVARLPLPDIRMIEP